MLTGKEEPCCDVENNQKSVPVSRPALSLSADFDPGRVQLHRIYQYRCDPQFFSAKLCDTVYNA